MCPNKKEIFILKMFTMFMFMLSSIGLLIFLLLWALPVERETGNLTDMPKRAEDYLQNYAEHMKSYMNFSVAPCDNFYEYACGNYPRAKIDHFSVNRRSNINDLMFTLNDITVQLLGRTHLAESLNVSKELVVAQRFYNACLGAELVPFPATDPAYLALIRSSGGFPAVDGAAWNVSKFSWVNMSAHLTNYGANGLINEKLVDGYPFEPYFSLPQLGFDHIVDAINIANNDSRAFRLNDKRMRGYLQAYNLSEERITEITSGVFAFWRDTLKVTKKFNEHCQSLSFEEGLDAYPPLRNYYAIAWNGVKLIEHNHCYAFFAELDKVCNQHPEAVANYLAMQLLYVFDAKLTEAKYQQEHCASLVRDSMTFLLDKLYMMEHFSEDKLLEVSAIVLEVRKNFRKTLEEAEWLDAESREMALLEESTLKAIVGSLQNKALTDRLIREIASVKIVEDSFATTNINLARHTMKTKRFSSLHFRELANDTLPQDVYLGMQLLNAYFINDHSFYLMAGSLEPPIYHRAWPQSLKFGTLGFIVGHQIMHGFDTTCSLYDKLTKKMQRVFDLRTSCFVAQYSNYIIPEIGLNMDGAKTKDKNIADNEGLRQAFAAYRSNMKQQLWVHPEQQKVSEQLPGLDLSPDQLFFLGFAQLWCSDFQEEHYYSYLTNGRTIYKYRVLGAISNSDDFYHAYNCPVGSGMRRETQSCRLW